MAKYTLKTAFEESFSGLLWRIEVDTARQLLAVETRAPDTGNPSFSVLHYRDGTILFREQPYGDRHWTLAGTMNGRVILKAFGSDSPEGTGIVSLDAYTGAVVWEQHQYRLVALNRSRLTVRHRSLATGYEQQLDPLTGNLTKFNISFDKPDDSDIVLPTPVAGIPAILADYAVFGDVLLCPIGPKNVWAFHERIGSGYRIRMVVTSDTERLDDRIVVADLPKMLPEIFFAADGQLFLLGDNKRKIVSYLV